MNDWIADRKLFFIAWGMPIAALIIAITLIHPAKTLVWIVALVWMGTSCLANARRCGRRHCFYTGPYFLALAAIAGFHGFGVLPLGESGWLWLGIALGVGGYGLWVIPERLWGQYANTPKVEE